MERIVVGVDGSEASRQAVQWARDEAVLRNASLELVNAYSLPVLPEGTAGVIQIESLLESSQRASEQLLEDVAASIEGVPVERHAIESISPSSALVEHAAGAALLVVSARGLGPFRRLLLGSVSQQVVLHARCPVVVIRPQDD